MASCALNRGWSSSLSRSKFFQSIACGRHSPQRQQQVGSNRVLKPAGCPERKLGPFGSSGIHWRLVESSRAALHRRCVPRLKTSVNCFRTSSRYKGLHTLRPCVCRQQPSPGGKCNTAFLTGNARTVAPPPHLHACGLASTGHQICTSRKNVNLSAQRGSLLSKQPPSLWCVQRLRPGLGITAHGITILQCGRKSDAFLVKHVGSSLVAAPVLAPKMTPLVTCLGHGEGGTAFVAQAGGDQVAEVQEDTLLLACAVKTTFRKENGLITDPVESKSAVKDLPKNGFVEVAVQQAGLEAELRIGQVVAPGELAAKLSVAPMMEWTDNHYREMSRMISRRTWLYTEMVVDATVIHRQDDLDRFLAYPKGQKPIVLQLGGSDPTMLAQAATLADAYGYDEINLNCGCPSTKVAGHGCFGARLMLTPDVVGDAVAAMSKVCSVPITVKCRIGVDNNDSFEELCAFVDSVSTRAPIKHFIIHARKALLKGLTPAQNRSIPPLKYDYVFGLIRAFPSLHFTINGGIKSCREARKMLELGAHGVMIGRAAYNHPWMVLGDADRCIFGDDNPGVTRRKVLEQYTEYAESVVGTQSPNYPNVRSLIRPVQNLFYAEAGVARWRRAIENGLTEGLGFRELVKRASMELSDKVLDSLPPPFDAEDEEEEEGEEEAHAGREK